jgi:hypothetical protein
VCRERLGAARIAREGVGLDTAFGTNALALAPFVGNATLGIFAFVAEEFARDRHVDLLGVDLGDTTWMALWTPRLL